ncbi:hypothetical protein J7K97_00550 [Candidatus Aerophobetes bacterium]|nr:hypothetical protein [Candidatus Aerophobetes bacterium]
MEINIDDRKKLVIEDGSSVSSIAFSPDGRFIASAEEGRYSLKCLRLWEVETGMCIRTFKDHEGDVFHNSFSPDGSTIASTSKSDKKYRHKLRIFNTRTGECIRVFKPWNMLNGHVRGPFSGIFSPDGKYVTGFRNYDKTIIWEVKTGKRISIRGGEFVEPVVFSPDGRHVAIVYDVDSWMTSLEERTTDSHLLLYDIKNRKYKELGIETKGEGSSICFSPNGKYLLWACGQSLNLYDVNTGKLLSELNKEVEKQLRSSVDYFRYSAFSPNGQYILIGIKIPWEPDMLVVYDVETGQKILERSDSIGIFSPDSQYILVMSSSRLDMYEIKTNIIRKSFAIPLRGYKYSENFPCYSPDGRYIAAIISPRLSIDEDLEN